MTAIDLYPGREFSLPNHSFKRRVEAAGIPVLDAEIDRTHRHNAVWPDPPSGLDRFNRVFLGMLTGFWIAWLWHRGRSLHVVTTAKRLVSFHHLAMRGAVVVAVVGVLSWHPALVWTSLLVAGVLGCFALLRGFTYGVRGNPWSVHQQNWFYKYPEDFHDKSSDGPAFGNIPGHIKDRFKLAEKQGWSWRIAWIGNDPLLEVYPPYMSFLAVTVGGWDTDNPAIDNF